MAPSPSNVALQAALDCNLRLLKKMPKNVDLRGAKDAKGENALHFSASKGCLESCKFLVEESGLDVNSVSVTGVTPMFYAALDGNVQVMRYLLDRGGDPAIPTDRGFTPLHNAAENGHCEAVRLLLSKRVHVDAIDYRGTPLHLAAAKDRDQVVKILLERGADAGADVNGHCYSGPKAVDDGLTHFVKFLLEAGADPNIPTNSSAPQLLQRLSHVAYFFPSGWFVNGGGVVEHGEIPIELAAARGQRELVEILFPRTKPIPSLPDWSVDGIIKTVKSPHIKPQDAVSVEERIADLKSRGKEVFAKEEYLTAMYFYGLIMEIDPLDTTIFANRSLCWLRLQEGDRALLDARQCKFMRPGWSKAWYREGAALHFLKDYKGAADAFLEALKLTPASDEIMEALREAVESMNNEARRRKKNTRGSADVTWLGLTSR